MDTDELAVRPLDVGGLEMRKMVFPAGGVLVLKDDSDASGQMLDRVRGSSGTSSSTSSSSGNSPCFVPGIATEKTVVREVGSPSEK